MAREVSFCIELDQAIGDFESFLKQDSLKASFAPKYEVSITSSRRLIIVLVCCRSPCLQQFACCSRLALRSPYHFSWVLSATVHFELETVFLNSIASWICWRYYSQTTIMKEANNVCPYVPRRPLSRDWSIVLESEFFSWQVYEAVIPMSLSLSICPYGDHFVIEKIIQLMMLSIVSLAPPIAAPAVPPCLIATFIVFSKSGALEDRSYYEIIWLQILKTLRKRKTKRKTVLRELRRCEKRATCFSA